MKLRVKYEFSDDDMLNALYKILNVEQLTYADIGALAEGTSKYLELKENNKHKYSSELEESIANGWIYG